MNTGHGVLRSSNVTSSNASRSVLTVSCGTFLNSSSKDVLRGSGRLSSGQSSSGASRSSGKPGQSSGWLPSMLLLIRPLAPLFLGYLASQFNDVTQPLFRCPEQLTNINRCARFLVGVTATNLIKRKYRLRLYCDFRVPRRGILSLSRRLSRSRQNSKGHKNLARLVPEGMRSAGQAMMLLVTAQSTPLGRARFVSDIYHSRREYRRTCETARKSGKQIERCVISSFRFAESMGFQGGYSHREATIV